MQRMIRVPTAELRDIAATCGRHVVSTWLALCANADAHGHVKAAQAEIALQAGRSARQVARDIRSLRDAGYVSMLGRSAPGKATVWALAGEWEPIAG